jgi:hypothetical protein
MTAKKDLKRRVRERQERTGESYVTARKRVVAARPEAIPVVQLVDLSTDARNLGLRGRVMATEELLERVDAERLLGRLRDALVATADDPLLAGFRDVLIGGVPGAALELPRIESHVESQRFLRRARAGIGGVASSGRLLAIAVDGRRAMETVVALLWVQPPLPGATPRPPGVMLTTTDGFVGAVGLGLWMR